MNPILISNPTNIRYLTGFAGASHTEREAYALLVDERIYLFTTPLYSEEVRELNNESRIMNNGEIRIIEISRAQPFTRELATICQKESIQKLDFEEGDLKVSEYEALVNTLKRTTLIHSRYRIENLRQIKRSDEIVSIKKAANLTDACFDRIIQLLTPGVTEFEIASEIESFFGKLGHESAFSPIVAFGKNTSKPHYNSLSGGAGKIQSLALKSSDIVLLDFGAKVDGYCADMTRMVFVGLPTQQWKTAYNTLLSAQTAVIDHMKQHFDLSINRYKKTMPMNGAELDKIARALIETAGYPTYPHSLGHALGLDIHESPRLYRETDAELLPGMVITIEPGVYIDGEFGMRIEDTVLITETGIDVLTKTPKELFVI